MAAQAEQRLAALEAEVAELRQAVMFTTALADAIRYEGYQEGRQSIVGCEAAPRPRRPRHLQAVNGGQE